jgi:N-acetylmuramoyl-L-alanine amidase
MHTRTLLLLLLAGLMLALPSAAAAYTPHDIAPGESLYSIAAADGLSVGHLAAANGLSPSAHLLAGATLQIPPQGASSGVASSGVASTTPAGATSTSAGGVSAEPAGDDSAGSSESGGGGGYVVQPGDTLSALAVRYGTSVAALAANNGLDPNGILRSGVKLQLSGGGGAAATSSSSVPVTTAATTTTPQPVGVNSPPYPTPERVSGSEVGAIANANGVPPSLAKAIGWQESGFNNALVSGADARGVMQILPTTWDWIQNNLTPSNPLAPASASENVRGGVLLLHSLLASTGGDAALAAAGYYQGLASVRRRGMFGDTQQYVRSVLALRQQFGGP